MNNSSYIDTTFDFRSDTPPGRDPDTWSQTLGRYHEILWSKRLPNGAPLILRATPPPTYLHHQSQEGELWLSSDAVVPTFKRQASIQPILSQIPAEEFESFYSLGYTIGGMMVFPAVRVDRHMTINGARGCHPRIRDRFDLTVECIRRHYRNEPSPLAGTLARYADFFRLFCDFRGYVEFFLLQDLVTEDCSAVRFFAPFDDFRTSPLPGSVSQYLEYRNLAMRFIEARNCRVSEFCDREPGEGRTSTPAAGGSEP